MDGGVLRSRTRAAGWKAQTNPLSYGGTHLYLSLSQHFLNGPTLASFYFYLKCKNVHLVWDLKSRPSDCESPPLTTRPGLFLSLYTLFKINNDLWGTTCLPGFLILKLSILLRLLNDILTSINTTQFVLVLILVTFRRIIICFVHSHFFKKWAIPGLFLFISSFQYSW